MSLQYTNPFCLFSQVPFLSSYLFSGCTYKQEKNYKANVQIHGINQVVLFKKECIVPQKDGNAQKIYSCFYDSLNLKNM